MNFMAINSNHSQYIVKHNLFDAIAYNSNRYNHTLLYQMFFQTFTFIYDKHWNALENFLELDVW